MDAHLPPPAGSVGGAAPSPCTRHLLHHPAAPRPRGAARACRLPLPGVVIFVHGVNSDGEWSTTAEQGLCEGLNARLACQEAQLALPGDGTGRLIPCAYAPELDRKVFVAPGVSADNFIPAPGPLVAGDPLPLGPQGDQATTSKTSATASSSTRTTTGAAALRQRLLRAGRPVDRRPQRPPLPVAHRPAPQPRTRPRGHHCTRTGPTRLRRALWPGLKSIGTNRPTPDHRGLQPGQHGRPRRRCSLADRLGIQADSTC